MSQLLINRNPDLKRLRDEGYSVKVIDGMIVVEDIPYVNSNKVINTGSLVAHLTFSGDKVQPSDHTAFFKGSAPCHKDGTEISQLSVDRQERTPLPGMITNFRFSNKPASGYTDNYHKFVTYINIISGPAMSIDPSVSARVYMPIADGDEENSVLAYLDSNASRASILHITEMFKPYKIGIIGLGGTGSYILDLIAKNPVEQIHLFDGDELLTHNAFRAPGAVPYSTLCAMPQPKKVDYYKQVYSNMHKGIYAHAEYMSSESLSKLEKLNYVFVAIDEGSVKEEVFTYLDAREIPYIDVGMGVEIVDNKLTGSLRTTMISNASDIHLKKHISMGDGVDNIYASNIQIAELNSINASLAVLQWKRSAGFYHEIGVANHMIFNVSTCNLITPEHEDGA